MKTCVTAVSLEHQQHKYGIKIVLLKINNIQVFRNNYINIVCRMTKKEFITITTKWLFDP